MISLSNTTYDGNGIIKIKNYSKGYKYDNVARISRQKTLDGSSVISHYGVTDTDRDIEIEANVTTATFNIVDTFFRNGTELRLSFWEGSYLVLIDRLRKERNGLMSMIFYVKEKLA
jgi:hypothetical protein